MKKINVENFKRQRYKRNIYFTAIMLFVCGFMIYNSISTNSKLKEENFEVLQGEVINFEVIEDEYLFGVKNKKENNKITTINLKIEVNNSIDKLSEKIKLNDQVKIYYDLDSRIIYKSIVNDVLIYDLLSSGIKSNNRLIIFYTVICALMIAYLIFSIVHFVKEPSSKEMDYIEYIITQNQVVTNAMLKNDSKTVRLILLEKRINKIALGIMVVVLFASIIFKQIFSNQLILFIISIVLVVAAVVAMIVFKPKLYSKNLKIFVDDYLDYLLNGELKTERTIFLNEESLKVIKDDEEFTFEYEELKLFSVGVYSKTNAPVNIFICSRLPEKEEYKDFEDFIIPLSKDIYQEILDNHVQVEGLDNLINNLYNETANNINEVKEGFLVKYYI